MNIRKAALVAEIVGGLGVIVSLLFVGQQVRSDANAQEAQSVLNLRLALGEQGLLLSSSPEVMEFVYRGHYAYESLDAVERYRYGQFVGTTLNVYSAAFEYGRLGRVDVEEFASWERGICTMLERPGFREVYAIWPMLTPDFRTWVDNSCHASQAP